MNLGTDGFAVDPSVTTSIYSQTTNALVFSSPYQLGDTLGGAFIGEARDWSNYATFGLRMTLDGANPYLPFTIMFFDSNFDIINTYQGTTTGLSLTPTVQMLGLSAIGTADFSSVIGMQFTWDATGPTNTIITSITEVVGFVPPTAGFFVVRAPGGVQFITDTNAVTSSVTFLAAATEEWIPSSFVALSHDSTSWSSLSDSNAKTDVTALDHHETLRRLSSLAVASWQYKAAAGQRYIGPMGAGLPRGVRAWL